MRICGRIKTKIGHLPADHAGSSRKPLRQKTAQETDSAAPFLDWDAPGLLIFGLNIVRCGIHS